MSDDGRPEELQQTLDESFDNWTGDEMTTCNDLVYKLAIENTTEQPILYRLVFKNENGGDVNLHWPINGVKGSLDPKERATVALLHKIRPGEPADGNQGVFANELDKLKLTLKWKLDAKKIEAAAAQSAN